MDCSTVAMPCSVLCPFGGGKQLPVSGEGLILHYWDSLGVWPLSLMGTGWGPYSAVEKFKPNRKHTLQFVCSGNSFRNNSGGCIYPWQGGQGRGKVPGPEILQLQKLELLFSQLSRPVCVYIFMFVSPNQRQSVGFVFSSYVCVVVIEGLIFMAAERREQNLFLIWP